MREEDRALLEELLLARGPGGQEDEVRAICQRELEGCCDEVGSDAAGNLVARISPPHLPREQARRAAVRLLAHLDEIAMIVKRVEADGTLRVVALGGAQPVSFGVCPVQILAGEAVLDGVLSYGSMHATGESPQGSDVLSGAVHWRDVHVVTRRSAEELANLGVRPGTRVVLNRLWRRPLFQDCVAAHFLDDRAPLLAVLGVAREIARRRDELHGDLYLVLTTMEEESNAGALFAARRLPGDISIAVEVGPTVAEYGTRLCRDPIVNSGDSKGYYSRHVTDRLLRAAERCQYQPQAALLVDFASDASALLSHGEAAQVGCIGIPTENTHGFEIVLEEGIEACRRTQGEFHERIPAHFDGQWPAAQPAARRATRFHRRRTGPGRLRPGPRWLARRLQGGRRRPAGQPRVEWALPCQGPAQ